MQSFDGWHIGRVRRRAIGGEAYAHLTTSFVHEGEGGEGYVAEVGDGAEGTARRLGANAARSNVLNSLDEVRELVLHGVLECGEVDVSPDGLG